MTRNPLTYGASSEQWLKSNLACMGSYQLKTTFFSDLSIAECFGKKSVQDTYNRVMKEWKNNIEYMTEFVLCLNHKIWQLYKLDAEMAKLYDSLWRNASEFVVTHFKGDDLSYYYNVID